MSGRRLLVEADGGSRGNPGPAGYGAVVRDLDNGELLAELSESIGRATNNVAEYRGMIAGLREAARWQPASVEVRMDSKLVVEQMAGRWQVKHPDMRALRREAAEVVAGLPTVTFRHIPRERNTHADRLANEAMDRAGSRRSGRSSGLATSQTPGYPPPDLDPLAAPPAAAPPAALLPAGVPTTMLLVRHGQTTLTAESRFSGRSDPELSASGQWQARQVADRLALHPPGTSGDERQIAVVTSPLRRARGTAEAVAAALAVGVEVADGELRETDFGEWDGLTFAEVRQRWPDLMSAWLADPDVRPPGGESLTEAGMRVRRTRDRLIAAHPGGRLVVVSHVTPVKALLRLALDAPVAAAFRLQVDPASLSQVDWYADGPAVVRLVNDTSHLDAVPAAEAPG